MKIRDVPAIPTLIVAVAIATMIGLGVWQLGRAEWKNGLLDRYAAAGAQSEVRFPTPAEAERVLYRRSSLNCARVVSIRQTGARSLQGQQGWAHVAKCEIEGLIGKSRQAEISLGWTRGPEIVSWDGGEVEGILAPAGDDGARLVAGEPPLSGLEPLPQPDPSDLPNNHLAYAGQWFFFALTALVIYILAMRSVIRNRAAGDGSGE